MSTPNQTDILALNEQLTKDLTARTAELATSSAEVARLMGLEAKLSTEAAAANAGVDTLTKERDEARSSLASAQASLTSSNASISTLTTERDGLKAGVVKLEASQGDFNKRLAGELSKHGIRMNAVEVPAEDKDGKRLTATERVQLAKGA